MKLRQTLRGRVGLAFAGVVFATLVIFALGTGGIILGYDHMQRLRFRSEPGADIWAREDAEEARTLGLAMLVATPITVLAAGLLGLWLGGRALAPVSESVRRARRALAGRGELQLPERGAGDEWDELAGVANALLRAQADAVEQARTFSANAAHELRTPLTAMLGELQVVQRRDRDPGEYRAVLARVEDEAQRLSRVVERLLALARADAGDLGATEVSFDLERTVRLAVERVIAADPAAAGRIRLRGGAALAEGDPVLASRVVDNLLDNALRHGGPSVEVAVEALAGTVQVVVSDDGPGIPPALRDRLFERFARGSAAKGGTGLGLSLARALAEAQGGTVRLDGGGGGARFVVELRRAPDGATP